MQNNPTYESNTADVGSGTDAFEMFENGASIEEINNKFFLSEQGSDSDNSDNDISADLNENQNSENNTAQESDNKDTIGSNETSADDLQQSADEQENADADTVENGKPDEKMFSQADLDSIVGRARNKEKGVRDRLQKEIDDVKKEVADYFGVSTEDALNTLRNEKLRREAEEKGYDDTELYSRMIKAENELAQFKEAQEEEKRETFVNVFLSDVENQLNSFGSSNPSVDIVKITSDDNFNRLLKDLYVNPATKDKCVEIALGAFGAKSENAPVKTQAQEANAKKAAIIDANKKRVAESAQRVSNVSQPHTLDYDNMSVDDFKKLGERAARGEIIVPSV